MAQAAGPPRPHQDCRDIGIKNPRAADQLVDDITARFETLADSPFMGVARDEVRQGLRMFPVGNYLIFYLPLPDGIDIIRVIDGRQNYEKLV